MENLLKNIEELREKVLATKKILEIERKKSEIISQKSKMSQVGFWNNREEAINISKEVESMEAEVNNWESLEKGIVELEELVAISQKENDNSLAPEAYQKYEYLNKKFQRMEFFVLFSHKFDSYNVILSIHAGTGGVDAQDWAEILERMYLRFAEKKGWSVKIIERTAGNEAGIKSVALELRGRWAYGYLKSENGMHRLVRISPFDAEAMRHTSFALVEVIPEIKGAEKIEIKEEDLRIDVFRSSGPGGQGINTTDSAVRIVHKPTKISVVCQTERSQHQNKKTALKILKSKLAQLEAEKNEARERKLRGEAQKAGWGKQIRSYVLQPYKMVKDHRSNYETQEVEKVLGGNIQPFIEAYLKWAKKQERKN